ncbi:hypothetical protein [Pseudosulfitobacter koreensis]|uniref:Uncharacterized protein n=1 Tax=Pseudosulfitobacter koreensis TaxID=2968472 RepID=A0ABT1YXX1_9RHOB|nr:hypothetical protein [Pseudosulfitobacter koreense]MCR8825732.1 hypothetical protein [Pseudosulfitobacter koreense]
MADPRATRTTANDPARTPTPAARKRGGSGIAFIVGGLVVVVAILAFVLYGGDVDPVGTAGDPNDINVTVDGVGDAAEDAGTAIEGAAESTGQAVEGAAESIGNAAENTLDNN